jgi:hypothetical protein
MNVKEIDRILKLHINYEGKSSGGRYLKEMDELTYNYSGPPGIRLSNMLDDYFKVVGVKNLDEAFDRLRKLEL